MWSLAELLAPAPAIEVVDVGAALGERPPYQSLVEAGLARVTGFEPNAAECERLNASYGGRHRFFPHFVGDGLPATMHETNWVLTGSLFEPNTPLLSKFQSLAELVTPVARHPVQTRRLDDIPEIERIDLLKIDVQGAELSVFQNATRLLAGTLVIQTEVEFNELYKGQPLFADVDACLRAQGFQFHTFAGIAGRAFKPLVVSNNVNQPLRQYLWADAIYVRDWMHLDALDAAALARYALLAHDVLGSYDLAHLVLAELDRRDAGTRAAHYLQRLMHAKAA